MSYRHNNFKNGFGNLDLLRVFSDYFTQGQCKTKPKKEDKIVLQLCTDISKAGVHSVIQFR